MDAFEQGLQDLYKIKKEREADLFVLAKLEVFRRFLGHTGWIGQLFHRNAKKQGRDSKETVQDTPEKTQRSPWRNLAVVVCVALIAGAASRMILESKRKA